MPNTILKRLDIIKNAITIEDEELIELQISKLTVLEHDEKVMAILNLLAQQEFARAVQAIEQYLTDCMGLMLYEDKELQGLKLELKLLEQRLQQLTEQKNDAELDIEAFHRDYTLRLGAIIQKLLQLKTAIFQQKLATKKTEFQRKKQDYEAFKSQVEKLRQQAEVLKDRLDSIEDEFSDEYDEVYQQYKAIKEQLNQQEQILKAKRDAAKAAKEALDDDPIQSEYQEAVNDSETFEQEYETLLTEEHYELTEEQLQALKTAYRKACKLCHPDIVSDELKEKAHRIMSELNLAKKKQDLARILEILQALQSGESFGIASDTLNNKEQLKTKIAKLKEKIAVLEIEIAEIEASEIYQLIQDIDDKEAYFEQLKTQLEAECEYLAQALERLANSEAEAHHQIR